MRDTSNRRKTLNKKTKLSIPFFQEEEASAYGTNQRNKRSKSAMRNITAMMNIGPVNSFSI